MEHNYQKIRVSMTAVPGDAAKGEEKKIDWTLEVLKKGKTKYEELIKWFSKEAEFPDAKLLIKIFEHPETAVLNMKSPREGLKNFSLFLIKEISDVPVECVIDPKVREIFDSLPDVSANQVAPEQEAP